MRKRAGKQEKLLDSFLRTVPDKCLCDELRAYKRQRGLTSQAPPGLALPPNASLTQPIKSIAVSASAGRRAGVSVVVNPLRNAGVS